MPLLRVITRRVNAMESRAAESRAWPVFDRYFSTREQWPRWKYAVFLLLFFCIFAALPYTLSNHIAAWRGVSVAHIEIWIDRKIPFTSWTIIFYIAYYIYIPIVAWIGAAQHRREEALVFFQRSIALTWSVFVIFIMLPVEVTLRDQVVFEPGFFGWFMTDLHAADPPFNSWPSLHVFQSLMMLLVVRAWFMKENHWPRALAVSAWVTTALIWYSTVAIKQHYVFDILTGLAVTTLAWHYWIRFSIIQTEH